MGKRRYLALSGDGPAIVGGEAPSDMFPDGPVKRIVFALEEAEEGLDWAIVNGRLEAKGERLVKNIREKVTAALKEAPALAALQSPSPSLEEIRLDVEATYSALLQARSADLGAGSLQCIGDAHNHLLSLRTRLQQHTQTTPTGVHQEENGGDKQ